jgi:limonene-1,2-epoxide hydrolase
MSKKQLIQKWVGIFNSADAEKLVALYSNEAVNHQIPNSPVTGKENIREMFTREFSQAEMTCIIENIFEDGEWVILEWKDPLGLRGCGFFRVINNKIVFQRGYWDKLTFLKQHNLPIPGL